VDRLRALPGVQSVSLSDRDAGQVLDVHSGQETDVTAAVLAALSGLSVLQVFKREPTLEDAYVSLIAGAAR
jgi:ABC-2 type transport system ATP-binding protein